MRTNRRRMAFIMAVVMVLALAPCITGNVARAADSDFMVVNGVITAYNGTGTEKFSIPDKINGETLVGVADEVFKNNKKLIGPLPSGLTSVGAYAFSGCIGLNGKLPAGLASVGEGAFYGCSNLSGTLNAGMTTVGKYAFYDCCSLTGSLPAGLTTIGEYAFSGCYGLTGSLPAGLTTVGDHTFWCCYGLTGSLPVGLTTVGEQSFVNCSGLTGSLPTGLKSVGDYAFDGCSGLTGSLPAGLTTAGWGAFSGCSGLTGSLPSGLTMVAGKAFSGCDGLTGGLPSGLITAEYEAFYNCTWLTGSLPSGLTTAGYQAFYGCTGLIGSLPAGLTTIGYQAFYGCSGLTYTLTANVSNIGWHAFPADATLYVPKDSYAQQWAVDNDYNYIVYDGKPLGIVSVTSQNKTLQSGETNTWTVEAEGGVGDIRYCFYIYKDGEIIQKGKYGASDTCSFVCSEPGVYQARAYAKDAAGTVKTLKGGTVTVTSSVPAPKLASVASKYTSREVSQANRWTPKVTGGATPLQYHYRLYKDGEVYQTFGWKTDASWAFTFTEPGEYTMQVRVKDGNDARSEYVTSAKITVTTPAPKVPVLSSVTTKYTSREVGTANRWTPSVTGGSGALQYHYRLYKDGVVYKTFGWKTSASYAVTFTEPGKYTMQVRVKDSSDARSEYVTSAKITVTAPAPKAPVLSSVATKYTSRTVGTANRWTPAVTGGTGALQYHYRLYKNGEVYQTFGWKTNASYAFTFTEPGKYMMQVRVKDANDMRSEYMQSPAITITK